jgi:signal transduction histidine kinase
VSGAGERCGRPGVALTLACAGIALCAAGFMASPHDKLLDPLTLILAACIVTSAFVSLELDGSMFWGGSLIPHICAFALLGPAPAAVISLVEDAAVLAADRYRLRMLPINVLGAVAPNTLSAFMIQQLVADESGLLFYAAVALASALAVLSNMMIITGLVGVFYGEPIWARVRRHANVMPAIAIPIAVAIAAVALYRNEGLGATAFVLAGVVIFAYVMRRITAERAQVAKIAELAESRGRLVAQVLEAEDRERRFLAEVLHDDLMQTLLFARQDLAEIDVTNFPALRPIRVRIDEAVRQARSAIRSTHPSVLDRVGLEVALRAVAENYASRGGFQVEVEISSHATGFHDRLVFSTARELISNVSRHANARTSHVRLYRKDDAISLEVTDDGCGLVVAGPSEALRDGHIGLASTRERIEAIGGTLKIKSIRGAGTRIRATLPIQLPASGEPARGERELTCVSQN